MPKTTGERWLSVPEAAGYLGVGMRTVYKFLDQGLIPAYRLGRVIRIKREDAEAFLEEHRIQPGTLSHLYQAPVEEEHTG